MKATLPTTEKIAQLERRVEKLEAALREIANGGSRPPGDGFHERTVARQALRK